MENTIRIAAVAGPTASGKTSLGIQLAKAFGGEILSCDSMQIYEKLSIGTAKPTLEEQAEAPHHLIGFCPLQQDFSVSDYVHLADKKVQQVAERGNIPIFVGGTGLYLRSFLRNASFEAAGRDETVRQRLKEEVQQYGMEPIYKRLQEKDPAAAEKIHPHNEKRVLRALEFIETTGMLFSQQEEKNKITPPRYPYRMICLAFRDREKLYSRINQRVDLMMQQGLLEETAYLYELVQKSDKPFTAAQAIGYKELFPYFEGTKTLQEAVETLKQESRRYAKRQITWFSREENCTFLYVDEMKSAEELLQKAIEVFSEDGFLTPKGG